MDNREPVSSAIPTNLIEELSLIIWSQNAPNSCCFIQISKVNDAGYYSYTLSRTQSYIINMICFGSVNSAVELSWLTNKVDIKPPRKVVSCTTPSCVALHCTHTLHLL